MDDKGNDHGLSRDELCRICRDAEFLLSVAGVTWLEEFRYCDLRIFLDTDPGFTQFGMPEVPTPSFTGYASPGPFSIPFHDRRMHWSTGLPDPDAWASLAAHALANRLRTVAGAIHAGGEIFYDSNELEFAQADSLYKGEHYGQKDIEFLQLLDLPQRIGPVFEIALAGAHAPREKIAAAGWKLVDPLKVTATPQTRTATTSPNHAANSAWR